MNSEISPSIVPTVSCASIVRDIQQIVKEFVLLLKLNIYHSTYTLHIILNYHIKVQRGVYAQNIFL